MSRLFLCDGWTFDCCEVKKKIIVRSNNRDSFFLSFFLFSLTKRLSDVCRLILFDLSFLISVSIGQLRPMLRRARVTKISRYIYPQSLSNYSKIQSLIFQISSYFHREACFYARYFGFTRQNRGYCEIRVDKLSMYVRVIIKVTARVWMFMQNSHSLRI